MPTKSFVKIGITKMFSSINKTFGCCSKIFGCSNKNVFVPHFVAVPKPFFSDQSERHSLSDGTKPNSWTDPSTRAKAAFHPASRQPARTGSVRKRLPFSLCVRPEVTTPS